MYLEIQELTKRIGNATVLDHIDLALEKGRIYGLRGKNGSGKTMLMRAMCGLILPTEGRIVIDGQALGKNHSFPNSVGALIEYPGFIASYSGLKNLMVLASIRKKVDESAIRAQMAAFDLDPDDKKKFRKYSLGMKQKLGIIAALMEEPDLILLDEPLNALDEKNVATVKAILKQHKQRGALIVLSCHDREELEQLADEVYGMENGRITDHYIVETKGGGDHAD